MPWSEAQVKAIHTYNKNLLVAAAAGSGKTAVLVERIIQRLLAGECDVDEILVVTFTSAAAAEMRERIEQAIHKALGEDPGSQHLQRQLVLLNGASISTLHSFCQSIVRQNFHRLGIDPQFRLASEQEIALLKRDVLETLFEEKYENGSADFLAFVDAYGTERSDEPLYDIVLKLYNYSCSQPFPKLWLESLPQDFSLESKTTLEQTKWMVPVRQELSLSFAACLADCDDMVRTVGNLGCEFYEPTIAGDREVIENLIERLNGPWEDLRQAVYGAKFSVMRAPKGTDEEIKEIFKARRQRIKDRIKAVKESYFMLAADALTDDLRGQAPMMAAICQLTADFAGAFARAKKEKALADFNDLEHFALRVLLAEDAGAECKPSAAALALQEKYREVMVDEYQDTNGVQEAILSLICRPEGGNLFLVGDVKQSIYRFRLAEPELFLDKYHRYPQAGPAYERIDLARNFRSRPEILAAINYVFAQVMAEGVSELPYGEAEALHPGPDYPPADGRSLAGPVEVHLLDRDKADSESGEGDEARMGEDLKGFALEARYIAGRIEALMREGCRVFDKESKAYRPLAWRDIVILLRSVKGKANVLLDALRSANIPAYASVEDGYFQETEIQVMLALLKIIDNPRQDIPLAAVLCSPLVKFGTDDLARIRLESGGDLYDALLAATAPEGSLPVEGKDRIMAFLQRLSGWRNLARRAGVPELIWQLFSDTGYYDYVGGTPGGLLRQANLRLLYDRAGEYEQTNFRGLFRFLRFIERMQDLQTDLASARTLGESEDVVRVMSIHKSKGLEFPVVVVADLGKNFNLLDTREVLLMHKKYGLGPYKIDTGLSVRYPTFARQAIACQLERENKAEELRVLYVALTRAREKLILVGSAKKLAERALGWCRQIDCSDVLLPDHMIAGARGYLDWIGPAVARHADGDSLREYAGTLQQQCNIRYEDSSRWQVHIVSAAAAQSETTEVEEDRKWLERIRQHELLPATENRGWVEERLCWRYPSTGTETVAAKLSVTEAKRRFEADAGNGAALLAEKAISRRPRFIQQKEGLSGSEYGTLMHSIMQHVDLQGDLSPAGLQEQLTSFAGREIIREDQMPSVNLSGISRFFASTLGRRILASPVIRREMVFSRMLPANRFYPEVKGNEEQIFIQGIVDLLFEEEGGLVLVDYKTDGSGTAAEIAAKYRLQIELYGEAVEAILQQKVKERYLYLFHSGEVVAI